MKNLKIKSLSAACAVLLFAAACSKATEQEPKTNASAEKTGQTASAEYKKVDKTYFKLELAGGGKVDLADWKDKPVFVSFITSVCPYCKKIAPELNKLYEKRHKDGLEVIMIALDDDEQAVTAFIKANNVKFPVAIDGAEIAMKYKARGVPYSFLLNKKHKVEDYWIGYSPSIVSEVEKQLPEAMAD